MQLQIQIYMYSELQKVAVLRVSIIEKQGSHWYVRVQKKQTQNSMLYTHFSR